MHVLNNSIQTILVHAPLVLEVISDWAHSGNQMFVQTVCLARLDLEIVTPRLAEQAGWAGVPSGI